MSAQSVISNVDIVLECQGVNKSYGDNNVLHDVNLNIIRGETVALVGPSGCGKSTLLKSILGITKPTTGKVIIYDHFGVATEVAKPGSDRGVVFQRYSLFPNLTAVDNAKIHY